MEDEKNTQNPAGTPILPATTTSSAATSQREELARISVKIPPFWHARPELWFAQVESQFATSGITAEQTKYHTVVAAIDGAILSQVSDVILNMPQVNQYTALKKRMLDEFSVSEQKRLKKLLQDIELGDLRPSQLLREMKNLAGNQVDDAFLKSMWMTRLPNHMRSIISISGESLDNIAVMADKISEVNDSASVHEVSVPKSETTNDALQRQIQQLTKEISSLKTQFQRSRSRNRSASNNRNRNNSREDTQTDGKCWYHRKFGSKAKKCREPCNANLN